MAETIYPIEGGCDCKAIRYRLTSPPMATQCCHCYKCQKRTGSAFVINAMYEADRVVSIGKEPIINTSKNLENLNHQHLSQCSVCYTTVWSTFDSEGGFTRFLRVGTLDRPADISPSVHVHTASKQPWVVIPENVPSFPEMYEHEEVWDKESLERVKKLEPLRAAHWDEWVMKARAQRMTMKADKTSKD